MIRALRVLSTICLIVFATSAAAEQTALVVIDMQSGFVERKNYHLIPGNQEKVEAVLARQAHLVRSARAHDMPIVVVEHRGHGPTNPILLAGLRDHPRVLRLIKDDDDAFAGDSGRDIKAFLDANFVRELIVTGANGDACVKATIRSALKGGYDVVTDPEAIADFNYPRFSTPYTFDRGGFHPSYTTAINFVQGGVEAHLRRGTLEWSAAGPRVPRVSELPVYETRTFRDGTVRTVEMSTERRALLETLVASEPRHLWPAWAQRQFDSATCEALVAARAESRRSPWRRFLELFDKPSARSTP